MSKSRKGPGVSNFLSPGVGYSVPYHPSYRRSAQGSTSPQRQRLGMKPLITPTAGFLHSSPHHLSFRGSAWFPTSPQMQGVGMVPHITPASGNQAQCPTSRDQTPCSTAPQGSLFQVHSTHLMSPEKLPLHPEGLTSQLRLPLAGPKLAAGLLLTFRISSAPWKGLPR